MKASTLKFFLNSLISTFFAIASTQAFADQFYVTLSIQCNPAQSKLELSFGSYWNEAGERAIALAGNDLIDPRILVTFAQDAKGMYSVHKKSISKKCVIEKNKYEISVEPLMAPRFHPEGFCAARIGAVVTIRERGKLLVNEGVDACTETGLIPTEILLTPGKPIFIKRISAKEFYAD